MGTRYEDLQSKGWVNLNGEERKEFQELKGKTGETLAPKPEVKTVTMTKEELESMIAAKIEEDRKKQVATPLGVVSEDSEWREYREPKKPNRIARFRRYREDGDSPWGLIVDWHHFKDVKNPLTGRIEQSIYKIMVQYDDMNKKEYEMNWLHFSAITDIEKVEIINEDRKKVVKAGGRVNKAFRDPDGYIYSSHVGGGEVKVKGQISGTVPLDVIRDEVVYTVRRENGQTFMVNANRING